MDLDLLALLDSAKTIAAAAAEPIVEIYDTAFTDHDMGYASAMAVMLFITLILITLAVARSSSLWVYYEAGGRR